MNEYIFKNVDYANDPDWVIKEYFNSMNVSGKFLWMLPYVINKIGCAVNDTYCFFPDLNEINPEYHFEGIMFGVHDGEIIVSESVAFKYVRLACEKYLYTNNKDKCEINELLKKIPKEYI